MNISLKLRFRRFFRSHVKPSGHESRSIYIPYSLFTKNKISLSRITRIPLCDPLIKKVQKLYPFGLRTSRTTLLQYPVQPRSQGLFPGLGAPKPGKRPWKKTLGTLYPVAYTSCMGVSRRELNPVSAATRRFSTPPWIGCLSITGISTALNFLVPIYTAGWGVVSFAAVFRKSRNAPPIPPPKKTAAKETRCREAPWREALRRGCPVQEHI